jgi:hypothetical protein
MTPESLNHSLASARGFLLKQTDSGSDTRKSECLPVVLHDSAAPVTFNLAAIKSLEGRLVVRCPEQLRLHRALDELGWASVIDELNEATRLKNQSVPEPILVTTNGTILAGFGRWRLAAFEGRHEIQCIEYPLNEDESLQFMLTHHHPLRGLNAFVRIRLALTLEPHLQQQALDNMRAGGKYKGLASLPDVLHIDVRQEIAMVAAVGTRNVSNVKTILKAAHPRLLTALRDGTLTINSAIHLCKLPQVEQLDQFIRNSEERATSKVIHRSIARPKEETTGPDAVTVLNALQVREARQPGSVVVRVGRLQRTVILVGQDLSTETHAQTELKPT